MSTSIRETLRLEKATIVDLSCYPGEKGMNCVLVCKAPLSDEAAKIMKCEERFYNINGIPYTDFQGRLTLKPVVKACQVTIGDGPIAAAIALLPDLIWKFNIGLEKDSRPSVAFRMHFDARWRGQLVDLVNGLNTDEFPITITASQLSLFVEETPAASGDGDRVDLSGQADSRQMTIGEVSPSAEAAAAVAEIPAVPINEGSSLPAMAVVGGTHQRKKTQ